LHHLLPHFFSFASFFASIFNFCFIFCLNFSDLLYFLNYASFLPQFLSFASLLPQIVSFASFFASTPITVIYSKEITITMTEHPILQQNWQQKITNINYNLFLSFIKANFKFHSLVYCLFLLSNLKTQHKKGEVTYKYEKKCLIKTQ